MKQIGLGFMQYVQDYDEMFPLGMQTSSSGSWVNCWAITTQPYAKTYDIYRCPSDDNMDPKAGWGWTGGGLSYAPNMLSNGCTALWGPIGGYSSCLAMPSRTIGEVARVTETILLAERHNGEVVAKGGVGNRVGYHVGITGQGWLGGVTPTDIPDGSRPTTAKDYPVGPNGVVTAKHAEMANFLFCDGHAKSMKPASTNPNPATRPNDNMWDARRK